MVPKLLSQVLVQELHNRLVISPEESGLEESREKQNNIITSDSTLHSILASQLNKISEHYKVTCDCKCFISSKSMHPYLLSWRVRYLKKLKTKVTMHRTEVLVKWPVSYLKHIIVMWFHMVVISTKQHLACLWIQCAPTHRLNMHYHTGNMYCCSNCP